LKLLLDENLSRRIVPALSERFPGSSQAGLLGLERSADEQLCDFAAENDFVLVSKNDDFPALVVARGYRPKLIQIALGNASNDEVLSALLGAADRLENALSQSEVCIAVINRDVPT
jgi:predicted nuclease of predicted toxin-antitoxin system